MLYIIYFIFTINSLSKYHITILLDAQTFYHEATFWYQKVEHLHKETCCWQTDLLAICFHHLETWQQVSDSHLAVIVTSLIHFYYTIEYLNVTLTNQLLPGVFGMFLNEWLQTSH